MFQTNRPTRVLVAAASVLLLTSVAMAGSKPAQGKGKILVKKEANGTVKLTNVSRNTTYESETEAHIRVGPSPAAQAAVYAQHYGLDLQEELEGGILKGLVERGTSRVDFNLTGEGDLQGFAHRISLPAKFEVHSSPRSGRDVETLETNMYRIEGEGSDDVFEYIRLVGGTAYGYPSPGRMTLTSVGDDQVMVDSFFNIGFRIEFRGAEGGPFAGLEDSIEGAVIMRAHPADPTR